MPTDATISELVNTAAKIATQHAMSGQPLEGMAWIPPRTPTDPETGMFVIKYAAPYSSSDTPPWMR